MPADPAPALRDLESWVRRREAFTVEELAEFAHRRAYRLRTLRAYLWLLEKKGLVRRAGRGRWEVVGGAAGRRPAR
jgi:predicted transcriptional regulator of viral defense system